MGDKDKSNRALLENACSGLHAFNDHSDGNQSVPCPYPGAITKRTAMRVHQAICAHLSYGHAPPPPG